MCAFNIRSNFKNIEQFLATIGSVNFSPDVFVFTETWLKDNNVEFAVIHGYRQAYTLHVGAASGGVSLFFKENFNVKVLKNLCQSNSQIESVVVELKTKSKPLFIIGIYQPHSGDLEGFLGELSSLLYRIGRNKRIVIIGDINIDLLNADCNIPNQLLNYIRSIFFMPLISSYTRFSPDKSSFSLLEHIWIKFMDYERSGVILTDITDHCPVYLFLPIYYKFAQKEVFFHDQSLTNIYLEKTEKFLL